MSTFRSVYTQIQAARSAIKDMARAREIASVLIKHGFGHFVRRWNMPDRTVFEGLADAESEESHELTGFERVTRVLEDLGPTFIKLGQILSTRSDLIPPELCRELESLQDNVKELPTDQARAVVEEELGRPIDEVFSEFDNAPLACASIAQVHRAQLQTGEEVVVKIQRPGIRETIQSDLHILYWFATKIEETVPEAEAFDPVAITAEFERAISRELDFQFEARNLRRFTRNFEEWPEVYIPHLFEELCTERVIVMERLRGCKITQAAERGHEMSEKAKTCVRMLFKMVFADGFFHGDLHPGNLWILDDGRIGLIDFGLVGRLNQSNKDDLADLFLNISTKNNEGVARVLYQVSVKRGKINFAEFEQDVDDLMSRHFETTNLSQVDFGAYLRDIIDGAIRHNLRVPAEYTMFFKAMMTVEGIGKLISPDLDIAEECKPFVEKLVAERYGPQRVLRGLADTTQAFVRFGQQFPIVASEILGEVESGRLNVGVEHTQIDRMEGGWDARINRLILSISAALLFLCATLVMAIPSASETTGSFIFFGVPVFSWICYVLSVLLAGRVLWRIVLSGRW